jgi:hypothetical protein
MKMTEQPKHKWKITYRDDTDGYAGIYTEEVESVHWNLLDFIEDNQEVLKDTRDRTVFGLERMR